MEMLRQEYKLGVNEFLRLSGIAKSTYYRRKAASNKVQRQAKLMKQVQKLCEHHPRLGYRPIHSLLKGAVCSASTVYRIMKRLELCQPAPVKRKVKSQSAPLDPTSVGLTIGLDFTHWQKQPICNVVEYESRYALATLATGQETAQSARLALDKALHAAKRLGLPHRALEVKSDHGSTFTADAFVSFLQDRDCQHTLSAVGRPQGMGRVERYNRSLKEQGLQVEDLEQPHELQPALNRYRRYYNTQRPHQALNYKTPLQVIKDIQTQKLSTTQNNLCKISTQVVPLF